MSNIVSELQRNTAYTRFALSVQHKFLLTYFSMEYSAAVHLSRHFKAHMVGEWQSLTRRSLTRWTSSNNYI